MIDNKIKRPSWDEYFIKIAAIVSERSTCHRHHVGAVIVKDKQILTTGYNGAVKGIKDCLEKGCLRNQLNIASGTRQEICRAAHAEQNAIVQAANQGININNADIYCTHSPCIICAKLIVNSGIKKVCTFNSYADNQFKLLFKEAKIDFVVLKRPHNEIFLKD
ncbi:cytidine/deoxycytidylate deaminase family protein [Candidatus Margulisiibacteriota bacterium]